MGKRIIIVDDDEKLRSLLVEYLDGYGFEVKPLPDGSALVGEIESTGADLVILDVMMPGKDGLEVLRDLRAVHSTPVIMLTAKGEEADRIVGLELGADDYLPKPFNPRELLARIKAVLRRYSPESGLSDDGPGETGVKAAGLALDPTRRMLVADAGELELSSTEYKIMEALMRRPNVTLNRDQLMSYSRGRDFAAFDRSIDVHISKLRQKLASLGHENRIKTVWGMGYMFVKGEA